MNWLDICALEEINALGSRIISGPNKSLVLEYAGRDASAAPACGYASMHAEQRLDRLRHRQQPGQQRQRPERRRQQEQRQMAQDEQADGVAQITALYLLAGQAARLGGGFSLTSLGGLYRRSGWFAGLSLVLFFAVSGLPPF